MSQTNNDNIKRPKLQGTLLGILKTYAFCQKLQRRASGSGESTAGVTWHLTLRIHQQLGGSRKGTVGA